MNNYLHKTKSCTQQRKKEKQKQSSLGLSLPLFATKKVHDLYVQRELFKIIQNTALKKLFLGIVTSIFGIKQR